MSVKNMIRSWLVGMCLLFASHAYAQDLQVAGLTLSTPSARYGQIITIYITIDNKGTRNAAASVTGVYYSSNSTISTGDPRVATVNVPQLAPNGRHSATIRVPIPPYYGVGQRWFGVIADYNNRVTETNNNNNTRNAPIIVSLGTAADLSPTAMTLSKTTVASGEKVTATFTINNLGNANAPETTASFRLSTNTTITTSDPEIISVKIPAIKAGGNYQGTASITIPNANGVRYVGIFVDPRPTSDPAGKIPEVNENNNTRNVRINIASADLQLNGMTVTPGFFKANDKITVTVNVRNAGQVDAIQTTLGLYFSSNTTLNTSGVSQDTKVGTVNVAALKAGATVQATATITVTATMLQGFTGPFYVLTNADDGKVVAEGSETNNVANVRVNASGIDLIVTKFAITPTPNVYARNEEVTVTFTVKNNGNQTAGASTASVHYSTSTNFSLNNTRLATVNVPSLTAGKEFVGTAKVRIPNVASLGSTRYLFAYADGLTRVTETSETNNHKGQSFVVGTANFQARSVTLKPVTGSRGTKVVMTYVIRNTGNKEIAASVVGVYYSTSATITTGATRLSDERIPKIAARKDYTGTVTITVPANARLGRVYFGIYADRNRQIPESSEGDNARSAAFTVVGNIDLQPTKLTPSTTSLFPSSVIPTVDVVVKNNGTDASGGYYVNLYWSTDNTWDTGDTYMDRDQEAALNGGATRTSRNTNSRIPASASGTGYIIAVVDFYKQVPETNETNNTIAFKITLRQRPGPDVIPDVVAPSNLTPKPGDTISVKVTIKNIGTASTGKAGAVSIYLSTNNSFSTTQDTFLGTGTMPTLASNASVVVTLTGKLAANLATQQYWVFAYVDSQRGIAEGNESNNWKAAVITVVKPNDPDKDGDGVPASLDCDDNDKLSYPPFNGKAGAPDICDGKDNDCDRVIDENNGLCPTNQVCDKTAKKCVVIPTEPGPEPTVDAGPGPEPIVDAGPGPEPKPDTTVGPEPKPDTTVGPESKPDTAVGPEPKPDAGVGPEPKPDTTVVPEPTVDAGPTDQSGCPGGCQPGEICVNGQCVPIPNPDNDETTADDNEGGDEDTEPVEDAGSDVDPPKDDAPDTNTPKDDVPDTSTPKDDAVQNDTPATTDGSTSTDTTSTTDDSVNKETGGTGDTGGTVPETPAAGCGCNIQSSTPLVPMMMMALFALLAIRRKKKQTS